MAPSVFAAPSAAFELHAVSATSTPNTRAFASPGAGPNTTFRIYVEPELLLDGSAIQSARVEEEASGPSIQITFTKSGAKRLGEITTKYIRQQLAFLIDGKLVLAPIVRDPILGGKVTVSGNFTAREAADLVVSLNASAVAPTP